MRVARNVAQAQGCFEERKQTLNSFHKRVITTFEVFEEPIQLAKDLEAATDRGADLDLTDDEVAFDDALATNDSGVTAMGDAA